YECGSLRHYKSECPIVKFHKRVDMIHGGVRETKPKTMQDAIEIATKLINKKISTLVVRQAKNKRKLDNTSKNNQTNNNRTRDKILAELTLHGTGASQKSTCYECGNQRNYRRDCLEQKNQNHENQIESTEACGVVHAFKGGETEQDLNNIKDEIEA
nr:hypothetical protein [Tanacetum cinerariifolium]